MALAINKNNFIVIKLMKDRIYGHALFSTDHIIFKARDTSETVRNSCDPRLYRFQVFDVETIHQ